jgi:competence ComEA-like helix-hairpin-helix protein
MKMKNRVFFYAPLAFAAAALIIVSGCSDHEKDEGVANEAKNGQVESYQAPGEIGHTDESTGSTTIQTKKTTQEAGTEKIPTIEETYHKADINRLSSNEFQKMGLSKDASDAVVKYRKDHGNFTSVDDLNLVPGVNSAWLDKMQSKLGVAETKSG